MDFRFRSNKLLHQFITKGEMREKIDQKLLKEERRKKKD
jgi:hypothetical protein